jgi:hypothetical protein
MKKVPGSKRLKLKYGEPLSNFAFKFNLRRYSVAMMGLYGVFLVLVLAQSGGNLPGF